MAQKITSATTYGGSSVAVYFGLTANEIAAFGGLFVAAVGLIANIWITWHFKAKHYKLKEAEAYNRRMARAYDEGDA